MQDERATAVLEELPRVPHNQTASEFVVQRHFDFFSFFPIVSSALRSPLFLRGVDRAPWFHTNSISRERANPTLYRFLPARRTSENGDRRVETVHLQRSLPGRERSDLGGAGGRGSEPRSQG